MSHVRETAQLKTTSGATGNRHTCPQQRWRAASRDTSAEVTLKRYPGERLSCVTLNMRRARLAPKRLASDPGVFIFFKLQLTSSFSATRVATAWTRSQSLRCLPPSSLSLIPAEPCCPQSAEFVILHLRRGSWINLSATPDLAGYLFHQDHKVIVNQHSATFSFKRT